jgi:EAL domain-containing protein (putative c-di-GMP-specific phosphodiesterase class I)
LEITESTLIKNEQVIINRIEEIKKLGVRLALDDFGTGYSSLIYLKQFKVDTIKIDRFFIQDLLTSDAAITKSIIYLAKGLNMSVIAEGVETKEQLNFLRDQNCHYIQGYLYSKPVSSDDFQNHLQNEYIAIH